MSSTSVVPEHPAALANYRSFAAVEARDRKAWLALFAEDAVVQDPVGISPLDPSGEGHQGRAAIGLFWDNVIANGTQKFDVKSRIPRGDECAVFVTMHNHISEDLAFDCNMIVIYRVNAGGLIASLRAFWDYQAVENQLAALVGG